MDQSRMVIDLGSNNQSCVTHILQVQTPPARQRKRIAERNRKHSSPTTE